MPLPEYLGLADEREGADEKSAWARCRPERSFAPGAGSPENPELLAGDAVAVSVQIA